MTISNSDKLSYEEWSEKNPIDWDKIENIDHNEDCLITKPLVEIAHRLEYRMYLNDR
jgi:hypothetical protein